MLAVRAADIANRVRCARSDSHIYVDVYGKKRTAYHPDLPSSTAMPALPTLTLDPDSKTPVCLRTKALSTVAGRPDAAVVSVGGCV